MNGAHILDALLAHAEREPERTAYIFVSDSHEEQRITRGQLCDRMRRVAANLLRLCPPGSRVALLLPQDADYVVVFWACLYAGLVPVPLYPSANAAVRARLAGILDDSGAAIAVGADVCATDPRHVPLATLLAHDAAAPMAPLAPATLAYLQYSSGSTGAPKGVTISHANIMANLDMIASAAGVREDDVFVNWLPLHHDLGLVNTVLLPAASGALSVLGTPLSFMRNPLSWLARIAHYGGTISGGPNFAYQAVLDRMRLRSERAATLLAGLDLGRWRVAFNAAEPIQAATQLAFASALKTAGFKDDAFFAAYGLAEATVFVSGGAWNRAREAALAERRVGAMAARNATVGCGSPDARQLLVVDADGRRVTPGVEGEIWIRGDHVSKGYFRPDAAAQAAFQRYTADGEGPFFATGDSGTLEDGQLYVLGRIKDIIIQNGRNIHPADVEQLVAAMLAGDARFGACAAIGRRQGGTEAVQLVLESRSAAQEDDAGLMERIGARVFDERGVLLDAIAIVALGSIDKTSSGKIRRQALRHALDSGQLSARQFQAQNDDGASTPAVDAGLEAQLAAVLSGLADVTVDDPHRSFFAYGISSLHLTQLVTELAQRPGMAVTMQQVLEHPTLRRLGNLIASLEPATVAAMATATAMTTTAGTPALSGNQQMMLSIDAWAPGNPAYHLPLVLALDGGTDPQRLARAARQTLARYEILRTVYDSRDGASHQARVLPADSISIDVEHLETATVHARLHALMRQGFDLGREPPVRGAVLVDAAARQVVLALVLHHVAADGWSLRLLAERLLRRYAGPDLPDDAQAASVAHLADVASHDASGAGYAQALGYWRRALAGLPDVHSLTLDHARAPVRGNGALGRHRIRLDAQAVAAIRSLCSGVDATLFSGIHALLALALARMGNERDVVLGTFLSGRDSAQRQAQIGFLAHTTLLRTRIDLEANLAATVRLCSDTLREAQRHAALGYLDLLRELKPARDPGYNPLFQITLNYHDYGAAGLPAGLDARHVELDAGAARYDLAVEAYPEDGALRIDFDYDATLFESGSIARLAALMQALLASALHAPATPAGLLSGHAAPALPPSAGAGVSLYRRFHEVAVARPQALALRHRQHSLSYGQLLCQSAALAAAIGRHAAPGARVLIFMQRTPCYVAAILATLRLDCTYVPLDPDYYQDALAGRIDFIAPACVLVDAGTAALLPSAHGIPVIDVQQFMRRLMQEKSAPERTAAPGRDSVPATAQGRHPAYILFTSGSTGSPKAVAMGHAALANLIAEIGGALDHAAPVVLNFSSIAFDMHFTEVFTALLNGGVVVLADAALRRNTLALLQLAATERVTLLNLSYPVLCELALGANQAGVHLASLRVVLSTAQQLKITPGLRAFFRHHPAAALFNHYGPTETHVVTVAALGNAPDRWPDIPAIGTPIRGTACLIVNASGLVEAPGAVGELYIAGVALAQGYYANPEMTAARFVELAVGDARVRAYRTGDFVRQDNTGALHYIGRKDQELKIRGMRIDLGDIEASLQRCGGVAQAVVVARPCGDGTQVIAYIRRAADAGDSLEDTLAELRRALPAYMMPDRLLAVEEFPLNQNGKIDVARLPLLATAAAQHRQPAQSAHEAVVHGIWRKVLGHDGFGRDTSFFEAGGDSLVLMAVKRELDLHYGRDIDLVTIYGSPSVATLALLVAGEQQATPRDAPRPRQNFNAIRRNRLMQARKDAQDAGSK